MPSTGSTASPVRLLSTEAGVDSTSCEYRGQSVLLRSPDFVEGATAFQQRRTPDFSDR